MKATKKLASFTHQGYQGNLKSYIVTKLVLTQMPHLQTPHMSTWEK